MIAIRKCGPLTKIFLCIVFAAMILAIVHAFTEKPIKESLDKAYGWSIKRNEQTLKFLHDGKPVVTIDKDMGLNLDQYAKKSKLSSHMSAPIIHDKPGTGPQGIQGEKGIQGVQGQTGSQGETGVKGGTGVKGEIGSQGKTGPLGKTGLKGPESSAHHWNFLFNGCCGGAGAQTNKKISSNYNKDKCQEACSKDKKCNAFEVNGCLKDSSCTGNCVHFYNNYSRWYPHRRELWRGYGQITTGRRAGCVTNGDQKCYGYSR